MTAAPLDALRISEESLRAIAAGNANDADLNLLCSAQRSQLLLILRVLLDRADTAALRARHPGDVPSARAAWELLCAAQRQDPGAVEAVLGDPTVMAWALRLLRRIRATDAAALSSAPLWADLGQFQALAAAAAARAGVPSVLRVPAHRGMVWLPGAGVAGPVSRRRWSEAEVRVEGRGVVVSGELTRVRLPASLTEPLPGWRPLRVVPGREAGDVVGGAAAMPWLDTVTPYRDFTRYPRSPGRSGERRLRLWESRLADAYALLDEECPRDAVALRALVRMLVPRSFQTARGGLVASASSLDAFGAVTLSLPYDATQTASVLVHESRHQQLNALLNLVPLVRDGADRLYYAPWRSDPRPLLGLLHGVFAFFGVARFWRTHRAHVSGTEAERAAFEFAVLREQVREALAGLRDDVPLTEAGRIVVDEMAAIAGRWQEDEVPVRPGELARHYCALRRAVWRARHLEIPRPAAQRLAAAWAAGRQAPGLPAPVLRPRHDLIRLDMFGPLVRYRLSAPELFARRRLREEKHADPERRAEYAVIAGDTGAAALGYAEWTARIPHDAEAWIGAALALPEHAGTPGAALLLSRPEVVVGAHRAVAATGNAVPADELAAWLAAADPGPARPAPAGAALAADSG
ncbi:HEXXH motif domain-containing protein [Streptomyces sp. NPDC020792]|uniref:HEXXH motif domain-containing protein n=1 Tax=Streptomyces sp. NPDC020792 TaxID=3365089 RepID=UPI0037B4EB93